ncbi:antibiotic biosynthesis monooxygenase [Frankia gtarii]|uniref:antibiotic biosynthesis monooxygenase n=1 Tax=Frankia gtarii TaxID=2950102 RepID=UPI0021C10067|nr:antibiotic biosynthesis monooxygenase [Frankia gtarii]
MPTIPWTIPPNRRPGAAHAEDTHAGGTNPADGSPADGAVEVMASHFVLTSIRHTVAMLRSAMAVRRAVLAAPGALGVSLVARPLRREYWTLSAWTDRAALDAFVGDPHHREAMRRLGPAMARSRFVFWRPPAGAGAPTWAQAHEHLAAPTD